MCLMFILMLTVLYIYLKITVSYHSNSLVEECVRIVPEHPRTAEAILPEFFIFQLSGFSFSEKEVAAAS